MSLLPFLNLCVPLGMLLLLEHWQEQFEILSCITFNTDGGIDGLVDIFWCNVKVNDTAATEQFGFTSRGCKLFEVTCHTIVKTCTDRNNHVRLIHGPVGVGATVHTHHVQRIGKCFVIGTESEQGGGHGDVGFGHTLTHHIHAAGKDTTLTDVEKWTLGIIDHFRSTFDFTAGPQFADMITRQIRFDFNGFLDH